MCYMPSPSHSSEFPITGIILVFGEYRSLSSSVYGLLHSSITSSLLSPNTLLSTLFSNTLSLRSTLNVSDQVSHSYKTTGTIGVLYILFFIFFWIANWKARDSTLNDSKRFLTAICSEFLTQWNFYFLRLFQNNLNFHPFK